MSLWVAGFYSLLLQARHPYSWLARSVFNMRVIVCDFGTISNFSAYNLGKLSTTMVFPFAVSAPCDHGVP